MQLRGPPMKVIMCPQTPGTVFDIALADSQRSGLRNVQYSKNGLLGKGHKEDAHKLHRVWPPDLHVAVKRKDRDQDGVAFADPGPHNSSVSKDLTTRGQRRCT
jgi:hypothetical protein